MDTDPIFERLAAIESRLLRLEAALAEADRLREALEHERESRRQLAEQAAYLLEQLGDARREVLALKGQAPR